MAADPLAPPAPPAAAEVFGESLDAARDYAELLAGPGVQRGLIGPREVDRLWERHLLNSAAVSVAVPDSVSVLDVGSGAGLPGIPLALVRADLTVTLVEPLQRRTAFLVEACERLGLDSVTVRRCRAEELAQRSTDVVVARAVAPLARLLGVTLPLLRPGGRLVALKGRSAEDEVSAAANVLKAMNARSWDVRDLVLPGGLDATRAVVVVAGDARRHQ